MLMTKARLSRSRVLLTWPASLKFRYPVVQYSSMQSQLFIFLFVVKQATDSFKECGFLGESPVDKVLAPLFKRTTDSTDTCFMFVEDCNSLQSHAVQFQLPVELNQGHTTSCRNWTYVTLYHQSVGISGGPDLGRRIKGLLQ